MYICIFVYVYICYIYVYVYIYIYIYILIMCKRVYCFQCMLLLSFRDQCSQQKHWFVTLWKILCYVIKSYYFDVSHRICSIEILPSAHPLPYLLLPSLVMLERMQVAWMTFYFWTSMSRFWGILYYLVVSLQSTWIESISPFSTKTKKHLLFFSLLKIERLFADAKVGEKFSYVDGAKSPAEFPHTPTETDMSDRFNQFPIRGVVFRISSHVNLTAPLSMVDAQTGLTAPLRDTWLTNLVH